MYKNLFFDLDDTLWAFSENARDAFGEVYEAFHFERYFNSFEHFYSIYRERNLQLWADYGDGKITKEQLNEERFIYPLRQVGVDDPQLATDYSALFFRIIPTKEKLMPHATCRPVIVFIFYRMVFANCSCVKCSRQVSTVISGGLSCRKIYSSISHMPNCSISFYLPPSRNSGIRL